MYKIPKVAKENKRLLIKSLIYIVLRSLIRASINPLPPPSYIASFTEEKEKISLEINNNKSIPVLMANVYSKYFL